MNNSEPSADVIARIVQRKETIELARQEVVSIRHALDTIELEDALEGRDVVKDFARHAGIIESLLRLVDANARIVHELRDRAAEHRRFTGVPCQCESSWHADELEGWADALASSGAPPQKNEETRVDHSQYQEPLATAASNELGSAAPTSADELDALLTSGRADINVLRFAAGRLRQFGKTIDALRYDLWQVAGTVVAACDSGIEYVASMSCMEGSPLVDISREAIHRYDLRNETTVARNQWESGLRGDPVASRTVNGEARDKESSESLSLGAPQRTAGGWRPIETAPKDGSWMLGWNRDCGHFVWRDGPGLITGEDPAPTHWQPLPPPPSSAPGTPPPDEQKGK